MARLRFTPFELDLANGELRRGDTLVHLQPQPLKVLTLLATRAGQLLSRDEIRRQIWAEDTFVDFDQGLNYCIRQIRSALDDTADRPRFIATIPRRGYRFLPPVQIVDPGDADRVMLAVLPFVNLSGDPEQEYFSDGLTDETIAQLGRLNPQRLGVIARTSAMRYKHPGKSVDVIGRELGVSFIVEGSVRYSAHRVRVTAQLIQVSDQTHLWAESIEREAGDILALQRDVARAVAARIGVQLTAPAQQRLASVARIDPGVYDAYLRGRYFWKRRSRDALERAIGHFQEAIQRGPEYAPAYAGLADVFLTQFDYNHLEAREAFPAAERLLNEALRLDDALAEPHTSLAHLRFHQFQWSAAEAQFRRAIALNPGYDTAHYYYANLLAALGRFDEATAEADRTVALDPVSVNARQNRLFILWLARRYDEAATEAHAVIEMDAGYREIHYELARIYERQGKLQEAMELLQQVAGRSERSGPTVRAAMAFIHARLGEREQAVELLRTLEGSPAYVSPYELAAATVALGDHEAALRHLNAARERYSAFLPFVNVDSRFDGLRADPRFLALLERLELPAGGFPAGGLPV